MEVSRCLAHVHRAGWVHGDLSPQNILLGSSGGRVHLLDFGFALRGVPLGLEPQVRGGTAPFVAPEVLLGWKVDGRADLFSLGVLLAEFFPSLTSDPAWSPLLERLTARMPGARFADAEALQDEVHRITQHPLRPARPAFGTGPTHGRGEQLREIVSRFTARPGGGLLLQGRPHVGVSRFIREAVLAVAATGGPAVRILDLTELIPHTDPETFSAFVADRHRAGEAIICGINDASPALRCAPRKWSDCLDHVARAFHWERMALPPLSTDDIGEAVSAALGLRDDRVRDLASALNAHAEGDLRTISHGLNHCVEHAGRKQGPRWILEVEALPAALSTWSPPALWPALADVPAQLGPTLAALARAGFTFPAAWAIGLAADLGRSRHLSVLHARGYLQGTTTPGRLSFVTHRLWRDALQAGPEDVSVDLWLHAHTVPDPALIDETVQACRRARRLQDREKERTWLTAALAAAETGPQRSDALALLAYPDSPPTAWTPELALDLSNRLADFDGWTKERVLLLASRPLRSVAPAVAQRLLEAVLDGGDSDAGFRALLQLLDRTADREEDPAFHRYRDRLESVCRESPLAPGILAYMDARQAFAAGDESTARGCADKAVRDLRGTGSPYESLAHQLSAILRRHTDPAAALASLETAARTALSPDRTAQLSANLALMYAQQGRAAQALACTEEQIGRLSGRVSPGHFLDLRLRRAWAWADLDHVDLARTEAVDLAALPAVRHVPIRMVTARLLIGFCHLHRGSRQAALTELAQAWRESLSGCPVELQAGAVQGLVDGLLDLDAWETVQSFGSELLSQSGERRLPSEAVARERAVALYAQSTGDLAGAAAGLLDHEAMARSHLLQVPAARYFHHAGRVSLALARKRQPHRHSEAAIEFFREELQRLPRSCFGYYRGRAYLGLAQARYLARDRKGALRAISRSVALAERLDSNRLLAESLQSRAAIVMGS